MNQNLPAVRHARVAALFATVMGLSACGGGGGGDAGEPAAAPAPGPSAAISLADCTPLPDGLTHRYLNGALDGFWAKRDWQPAMFLGEPVTARHDYATVGAATASEVWYFTSDAGTRTVLGREMLNADGSVATRVQFVGWVESRTLAAGASETIDYTVKTLLPAGQADTRERLVRSFTANREVTLPGGRLNSCQVDTVLSAAPAGGTLSEQSRERLHYAPGLGVVKRYLTRTSQNFVLIDKNQTYVNELVGSTHAVPYVAADAASAPTLAQCAAIATGQTLQYTASNPQEALSDKRRTADGSFAGVASRLVSQRSMRTDTLSKIAHFDAAKGALQELGYNIYGANEAITATTTHSGRPDLSTTAVGQTVDYTETTTTTPGNKTSTSKDSFTFVGHEKVATYAGEFDACKVRFDYDNGDTETYYLAPNVYWVRLDASIDDVRTTREMVKLN